MTEILFGKGVKMKQTNKQIVYLQKTYTEQGLRRLPYTALVYDDTIRDKKVKQHA
jgi:ribosomal protein S24E